MAILHSHVIIIILNLNYYAMNVMLNVAEIQN